jgi:hypothetical protein
VGGGEGWSSKSTLIGQGAAKACSALTSAVCVLELPLLLGLLLVCFELGVGTGAGATVEKYCALNSDVSSESKQNRHNRHQNIITNSPLTSSSFEA